MVLYLLFFSRPEVQHYSTSLEDSTQDFSTRSNLSTEVIKRLELAELKVSQAHSLQAKFVKDLESVRMEQTPEDLAQVTQHMENFVRALYVQPEVSVIGAARGPGGQLIRKMFIEEQRALQSAMDAEVTKISPFPQIFSKEYVLKLSTKRPYIHSRPTPQRLYAFMNGREFRAAGAFSIDKQYL